MCDVMLDCARGKGVVWQRRDITYITSGIVVGGHRREVGDRERWKMVVREKRDDTV